MNDARLYTVQIITSNEPNNEGVSTERFTIWAYTAEDAWVQTKILKPNAKRVEVIPYKIEYHLNLKMIINL